jgi:hypothetical protein
LQHESFNDIFKKLQHPLRQAQLIDVFLFLLCSEFIIILLKGGLKKSVFRFWIYIFIAALCGPAICPAGAAIQDIIRNRIEAGGIALKISVCACRCAGLPCTLGKLTRQGKL